MRSTSDRVINQSFRFELDPNRKQRVLLAKSVGVSRYVYNWGLAESRRTYQLAGKRPTLGELKTWLVGLKKGDCPWLYEVSAHIGQQALADLDKAFDRFFKRPTGQGAEVGLPTLQAQGRAGLSQALRGRVIRAPHPPTDDRPSANEGTCE
jgi:hypothetical protein